MIAISLSIVMLPRHIIITIIIILVVVLLWTTSYRGVKEQGVYENLTGIGNIVAILGRPDFSLETTCDTGDADLNNCGQFKYKLLISNMNLDYAKDPFDMIITVAIKDFDQIVSYSINKGGFAEYHRADFGEQGTSANLEEIELMSQRPPILNFPDRTEYSGSLWNQQTIRLGDYAILGYTSFFSAFRSKPDVTGTIEEAAGLCKARFFLRCGTNNTFLGENNWIMVENGATSQPISLCRGTIEIAVDKDEGSDCIKQKICKLDIKAGDAKKELSDFGEKVDITFWRLTADDNEDGQIDETENNYDKFKEKCFGKKFTDNIYCGRRKINTRTFYIDVEKSTDQSVPKGC